MATGRYSMDMTTGSLFPKIISFALPLMLTGLLQIVYNAADAVIVGRFSGSLALAAVGATSMLVNLTLNLFLGLSMGSGVVVAKHIGANNTASVHRTVHSAMLLSVICGFFIGAVGILVSPFALELMDTPSDVFPLSVTYMRIFFLGTPASMIYNFGAAILRATGDSKRPLYILTATGILNVLLNVIFVVAFKMSVSGVALATVISQLVSAICILYIFININSPINLSVKNLRFYKDELREIIKIGLPAGLQSSLFSLSNVIIQSSINSFGAAAIAGNTASGNIDSVMFTCCNAVSQTATTFTSQNYGAGKFKRIRSIYFNCLGVNAALSGIFCVLLLCFGPYILSVFSTDSTVIDFGMVRLKLFAVTYITNSFLDVTTCQMRGLGKSVIPMIVTLAGVCGLRVVWVFTVFRHFRTLFMLYFSYPVSWLVTGTVLIIMYAITFRKIYKRSTDNEASRIG